MLSESLSAADVHYLGLADGLAGYVVPSRINGILAAGRPVIVAADPESESAQLVQAAACGVAVPPGDPPAVADAIRRAYAGSIDLRRARRGRTRVDRAPPRAGRRHRPVSGAARGTGRSREPGRRMIARYGRGAVALLAALAVIAAWNVVRYPPGLGYDAIDHIAYAQGILDGKGFPDGVGEYYTPPGFYVVVAGAIWLGETLGLGQPLRVTQLIDAVLLLATAVLLLELARLVFPDRRRLRLAALGLFVFGVLAPRSAAMVHPETMSMFFSTLALVLAARMIARPHMVRARWRGRRCRARRGAARAGLFALDICSRRARARHGGDRAGRRAATDFDVALRHLARNRGGCRAVVRLPGVSLHEPDLRPPAGAGAALEASARLVLRRPAAARAVQLAGQASARESVLPGAVRGRLGRLLRCLRLEQR